VNRGRNRIGGLIGAAAAAIAVGGLAPAFAAQQSTPTPTPLPAEARPPVTVLPNVTPERFTLGTPTPAPVPIPAPTPTPTPTPTPAPVATPTQAAPRTIRTPAPTAAAAPRASDALPAPTPVATSTAAAAPAPEPSPVATPSSVQAVPTATQSAQTPGWIWMLAGAAASALALGGLWALQRRRRRDGEEEAELTAADEIPAPAPAPQPRVAPPPGIAPSPAAPASALPSGEPFEILVRPARVEVTEREVLLDLELLVGNRQSAQAENVRAALALISASPDQDRAIAGYHATPLAQPSAAPFDLASGAGARMPVRLSLPREHIHVVQVGGRPMFVPLMMVELKWRAGISIRRFGADFMIGTAGQGAKLGPIWLDRVQPTAPLAATRYLSRQAAAA
jgi:hypothetical protein